MGVASGHGQQEACVESMGVVRMYRCGQWVL